VLQTKYELPKPIMTAITRHVFVKRELVWSNTQIAVWRNEWPSVAAMIAGGEERGSPMDTGVSRAALFSSERGSEVRSENSRSRGNGSNRRKSATLSGGRAGADWQSASCVLSPQPFP
jgi:hypothetical protein